jgi:SAM-dependent methyltransferase
MSSDVEGSPGIVATSTTAAPTSEERAAAAAVLRMIGGVHVSQAVYVAAELGVADLLAAGPMTAGQLAVATATDEPSLFRVLRLLASLGVLREQPDESFGLTVLGERLRSNVPASMRSWAQLVESCGGIRAFEPIIARGMPLFEFLAQHPERAARFNAAMSERTAGFAPSVAAGYDFSPMRTVVDIGGGKGTLLAAILAAHPDLRGVLFDLPNVTAEAGELLAAAAVADRCEICTGDFFEAVPAGADAYILANVLHDWDDPRAVEILAACRQSMAPNGRVLIVERLIPDDVADAVPVLISDFNMLVFTGGRERTNAEYAQLLHDAGLTLGKIRPVATPYGVIEGLTP